MAIQIVQIVDLQQYYGQTIENVTHWVDTTGVLGTTTLLTDYQTNIIGAMKAVQHPNLTHTSLKFRKVYPTADLQQEKLLVPVVPGTDGNDPAVAFAAYSLKFALDPATVTLSGGFTGHIKRGGMRIGGITNDATEEAGVSAGVTTSLATLGTRLTTAQGGGFLFVVVSYLIGNKAPGGPPRARSHTVTSYTLVTSVSPPSASTQNSRKVLRGRTF